MSINLLQDHQADLALFRFLVGTTLDNADRLSQLGKISTEDWPRVTWTMDPLGPGMANLLQNRDDGFSKNWKRGELRYIRGYIIPSLPLLLSYSLLSYPLSLHVLLASLLSLQSTQRLALSGLFLSELKVGTLTALRFYYRSIK